MTMTERTATFPEFAIVLRGYDRIQVDDYIDKLDDMVAEARSRVEQAELRAEQAERESMTLRQRTRRLEEAQTSAPPRDAGDLGARVAKVLELADHEADELRRH